MTLRQTLLFVVAAGLFAVAWSDEILFKSGDRLTGTILTVSDNKMTFDSKVAGKITLDMADIKTFTRDTPLVVALTNATFRVEKATAAGEGFVSLFPEDGAPPKTLALEDISKINPEKPQWKGAVTAGATMSRGNTENNTCTVHAETSRRSETDRTTFSAGYYFANQRNNTTGKNSTSADEWYFKGQYDYFLTTVFYGYGNFRYDKDRIANLNMRSTPGLGLGWQWVETEKMSWSTEAGLNWVYEKYSDPEETRRYTAGRVAWHFDRSLNELMKLTHNLEYIPSMKNTDAYLVNADVGLRAAITSRLILEVKTELAYNSQPADDKKNSDVRYILSLGWTF